MTETTTLTRPPIAAGDYVLDAAHSHVGFLARHLMVSKVRGSFATVNGRVRVGETVDELDLDVVIDAASVTTGDAKRDDHLRSADFFHAERFPHLTFRSTSARALDESRYQVTGDLTIRDQTHPVTLDVEYLGAQKTPWGHTAAAISATTEIDREQWGLTWNVALEQGGVLVGKRIQIDIEAEVVPAPAES
jgi:polyisoprenoid-binding protein YceI